MNRWPTKPLGELCDVRIGRTPRRDNPRFWGGHAVWVTIRELNGGEITSSKEMISDAAVRECMPEPIPAGTLLFSFKLSIGKMAVAGCPLYTNEAIAALPIFNPADLSRDFLRYALLRESHEGTANTAVMGKVLNKEKVQNLSIPVPPLAEQERIVKLLDEADALRKLRTDADRCTAALIPALFDEMFDDPSQNSLRLPLTRLADLCAIPPNYGTMVPARANGGAWLTIRVANIQNDTLNLTSKKFVTLENDMLERHTVREGDLLLARAIGSEEHLGKCIIAYPGNEKWAFDSHLMRVRLDRQKCEPEWVKSLLESVGGRQLFLNNTRKSAVQFNINSKEFGNIVVPLPELDRQREFLGRVREMRELTEVQSTSRVHLDALFQSMLHGAFTGEI
jgi:type I restriction enzyme S subunit